MKYFQGHYQFSLVNIVMLVFVKEQIYLIIGMIGIHFQQM